MKTNAVFALPEEIRSKDYVLATYYIELGRDVDVIAKASSLATGQTIGTWVPVPGITDEMLQNHMGKVVNIFDIPPCDLSTQLTDEKCAYLLQIAYPTVNFGAQFPMLLTTLLGNDASTSAQVKLLDIQLPDGYLGEFGGPNFGIEGVRRLTGVEGRPLILNMIKPCTGLSPKDGARIFYETALGGVDLIKDDELLGSPRFSTAAERVKEFGAAARAAYEKTGKKTVYIVNITDNPDKIVENARQAVELGAQAVMLNFATVGYGMLQHLARSVQVPILGHYAGSGMFYEGTHTGMSSTLAVGKLPRLAGADIVMLNTPYGGYPLKYQKYIRTAQELSLPCRHLKPAMPAVGGGVHPGVVEQYVHDLGVDIVLSPGGAVQGHPGGAAAGARAMRQAVDAVMAKIPLDEAAREHAELAAALALWGYRKTK